jgi:hypothetical protein
MVYRRSITPTTRVSLKMKRLNFKHNESKNCLTRIILTQAILLKT